MLKLKRLIFFLDIYDLMLKSKPNATPRPFSDPVLVQVKFISSRALHAQQSFSYYWNYIVLSDVHENNHPKEKKTFIG